MGSDSELGGKLESYDGSLRCSNRLREVVHALWSNFNTNLEDKRRSSRENGFTNLHTHVARGAPTLERGERKTARAHARRNARTSKCPPAKSARTSQ